MAQLRQSRPQPGLGFGHLIPALTVLFGLDCLICHLEDMHLAFGAEELLERGKEQLKVRREGLFEV